MKVFTRFFNYLQDCARKANRCERADENDGDAFLDELDLLPL